MSNQVDNFIDYDALAIAIKSKVGERKQEDCAHEVGISAATFSRLVRNFSTASKGNQTLQSETVLAVCKWLDRPLESFTRQGVPPGTSLPDDIEWYLLHDPKLTREAALELSSLFRSAYKVLSKH